MSNKPTLYSPNNANKLHDSLKWRRAQAKHLAIELGQHLEHVRKALTRPQWTAFRSTLDMTDAEVRKFIDAAR